MRHYLAFVLSLPFVCHAGDSVTNTNPTIAGAAAVKGAACTRNFEELVTVGGKPLICRGGKWRDISMNGYERVKYIYIRTAADNYKTLTHFKTCPAGKRLIQTDCNFNGGTNQHAKNFVGALDDYTAVCFFQLFNAYDPAYPGGLENSLVTTAYCVDDE